MVNKLPILANNGRDVIGYAKTTKGAEKIIRKLINIHPKMQLNVWMRNSDIVEMNGGLSGWMFSISYSW